MSIRDERCMRKQHGLTAVLYGTAKHPKGNDRGLFLTVRTLNIELTFFYSSRQLLCNLVNVIQAVNEEYDCGQSIPPNSQAASAQPTFAIMASLADEFYPSI